MSSIMIGHLVLTGNVLSVGVHPGTSVKILLITGALSKPASAHGAVSNAREAGIGQFAAAARTPTSSPMYAAWSTIAPMLAWASRSGNSATHTGTLASDRKAIVVVAVIESTLRTVGGITVDKRCASSGSLASAHRAVFRTWGAGGRGLPRSASICNEAPTKFP